MQQLPTAMYCLYTPRLFFPILTYFLLSRKLVQDISIWPFSMSQSTVVYVAALQNNCPVSHSGWRKYTGSQEHASPLTNIHFWEVWQNILYHLIIDVLPVPDSFRSALKSIKIDLIFSYEPCPRKSKDQCFA